MKRLQPFLTLSILLLGCCSAWRPDAAESYARAMQSLREGEYGKARDHFQSALRSRPDDRGSQVGLLNTLREVGLYEEARKRAGEFLSSGETVPGLHLELGRSLAAVGEYGAAEKHFRRSMSLGGNSRLEAIRDLGLLLEGTGRRREALALWNRVIDEYRRGGITGSEALGVVAVAAWRRGWAQDAKDVFLDATTGEGVSPEALSNFGYLFLEKYEPSNALGVFRDCLKINPRYPPALMGIALAKKYESNDEVEKYARAALEVNPNLVPAYNLLAELRIQEESFDDALQEIRRAQKINPSDLESLSLEAVYHQLYGDRSRFSEVEKRILEIDPSFGRLYYIVAENLVMRRKYREAVEFNRKALNLDPDLWAAHASLGMNLMRVGELAEGRRAIGRAFEGDPYNTWAFNTLNLLDQMDQFAHARTDHFVFRMSREDQHVLASLAGGLAEESYRALTKKYRFVPEGPIQIEIFPDHGGFAVRTLGLPGLGALGVCFGKVVAMDSPRARRAGTFNWGSTLWHEFAHVITLQMTRHNIPRWFSEGISVYEERRARPGWGDDLNAAILKAYSEGKLLKVSELNMGMMRPRFPEQVALSYYQASLVCEMIEERFGFEKIREALLLFAETPATEEVFRRVLGWDTATLDSEYAKFLDSRLRDAARRLDFKRWGAAGGAPADKEALRGVLEKNPDDFFANLMLGALLRKEKSNSDAEVHLRKALTLFPEYVEPGSPYHLLSELYLEEKKPDDLLAVSLSWSRYDENASEPLLRAADIYAERKQWPEVVRLLNLYLYIQPYDSSVYSRLGQAALDARDWPSAVDAFGVLVALNPPDAAGAHFNLARALHEHGRKREARKEILRALEIAPTFEKAQELLLKLSGGVP